MKKLLSTLFLLMALFAALDATAQIKDGSATVSPRSPCEPPFTLKAV